MTQPIEEKVELLPCANCGHANYGSLSGFVPGIGDHCSIVTCHCTKCTRPAPAKPDADVVERDVPIPDHGITDAEMWADVDAYHRHEKILVMLKEACPSVFLTNRNRLAIANKFAPMLAETATLSAEKDKWRLALESLTPQGSEFYNDIDNCVDYVRKRLDEGHEAKKQVVKLQRALGDLNQMAADVRDVFCPQTNNEAKALINLTSALAKAEAILSV